MSKSKEYIFRDSVTVTEETSVMAKSFDEAVDIFLSGGGSTDEVDSKSGNWECIHNADDFEDDNE